MTLSFVRGRVSSRAYGHDIILISEAPGIIAVILVATTSAVVTLVVKVAVYSHIVATTTPSTRACIYGVRGYIGPVVLFLGLSYSSSLGHLLLLWQGQPYSKEL